jgi:hypothetical protein
LLLNKMSSHLSSCLALIIKRLVSTEATCNDLLQSGAHQLTELDVGIRDSFELIHRLY